MLAIHDHVALKAESLQKFGLSFGTCLRHLYNGLGVDGVNCVLELRYLDLRELLLALNL